MIKNIFTSAAKITQQLSESVTSILEFLPSLTSIDKARIIAAGSVLSFSIYINNMMPVIASNFYGKIGSLEEGEHNESFLNETLQVLIIYSLCNNVVSLFRNVTDILIDPITIKASQFLHEKFFEDLKHLSADEMDKHNTGEIYEKIKKAGESITNCTAIISNTIPSSIDFLLAAWSIIQSDANSLKKYIFTFLASHFYYVKTFTDSTKNTHNVTRQLEEKVSDNFLELLENLEHVSTEINIEAYKNKFVNKSHGLVSKNIEKERLNNLFHIGRDAITTFFVTVLRFYLFMEFKKQNISINEFRVLDYSLMKIIFPVDALLSSFNQARTIISDIAQYARLRNTIFSKKCIESKKNYLESGDIDFQEVDFLRDSSLIFSGVNFSIKSGNIVKLEGKNGTGKSTLIKLLQGLYSVSSGKILIDNLPVENYSPDVLKKSIIKSDALPAIYNDTLVSNLSNGFDVSHESMNSIIDLLINQFNFPGKNLSSHERQLMQLGKNGIELSSGQRQLLGIGRILLKFRESANDDNTRAPKIVILDEAFSHIDDSIRNQVISILMETCRHSTIIIVDHQSQFVEKYIDQYISLDALSYRQSYTGCQ